MVLFIPYFVVDCVHALAGVGVYFTPLSINIIDRPVSGCKREAGCNGGKDIAGTESFGFGGDVDVRLRGRTYEGGREYGWDEDREVQIVKW